MNKILGAKSVRIWMIVGALLVALLLAVNLVANYFSSIISIALGGDRPYEVDKENPCSAKTAFLSFTAVRVRAAETIHSPKRRCTMHWRRQISNTTPH